MLRSFLRWLEVWLGGILGVSSLAFPRMDPVPSTEKKTEISPGTDRVIPMPGDGETQPVSQAQGSQPNSLMHNPQIQVSNIGSR